MKTQSTVKPRTIVPPRPPRPRRGANPPAVKGQNTRKPSKEPQIQAQAAAAPGVAAAPAALPHLTYQGGPLLTSVEIYTVFWGAYWEGTDANNLAGDLNDFFSFIVTSPLIDALAEYSIDTGPNPQIIGYGSYLGTVIVTDLNPGSVASDGNVQAMLQAKINANFLPQPNGNILYFVFLPPGTTSTSGDGSSCLNYCGYHSAIDDQTFYAVIPDLSCPDCRAELSLFDALTSTSSHELCEAITDPVPGQGWYDNQFDEIGDYCAWTTNNQNHPVHNVHRVGPYVVQKEWSNTNQSCQ